MILDSFDISSPALINPSTKSDAPSVDACIMTFSYKIEQAIIETWHPEKIASLWSATGETPVWLIPFRGKRIAVYKTIVGAPACGGLVEDTLSMLKCRKYVLFGGAGCLNKEIAHGRVMVPTEAYRDEGMSYHYAPPADYISMKNSAVVARFMEENGLPYVTGRTWTTDAFYRETRNEIERHKADGCISVEMESAGVQAVCDFRGLDLYVFFTSGDLLDAPVWDSRRPKTGEAGTQHDLSHFEIALSLAAYAAEL